MQACIKRNLLMLYRLFPYSFALGVLFCLGLLMSLASPAYADQNENEDDLPKQYGGFMGHLYLGSGRAKFSLPGPLAIEDDVIIESASTAFGYDLGYAFNPNWIAYFGGQFYGSQPTESPSAFSGRYRNSKTQLIELIFEVGASYYFLPQNYYVSLTGQRITWIASVISDGGYYDGSMEYRGRGIKLALGKEWWFAKQANLGLNFSYRYAKIEEAIPTGAKLDGRYNYYGLELRLGYDL